jgi:aspartyl protease family protein
MQGSGFKFFSSFMVLAGLLGTEAAAQAAPRYSAVQDDPCYFVTASGQRMSLGRLCGQVPPAPAASGSPNATKPVNGVVRVKIKRRVASTPVIEVVFNGDRSFEMIVDTGASGSLITQEMASALKVRPTRTMQAGIADGSIVRFPVGRVRSMAVGGLTVNNIEVAISGQMDLGLLGHDFFGNYDLKIKRDVIEFYPR